MDLRPSVLIVLDGWGHRDDREYNAINQAQTPCWDRLWANYPHALISGSGLAVGLPEGQMGNSEVGHMNIGAGRTVYQDLTRIDQAIADGEFAHNVALNLAIDDAIQKNKTLHVLGLLSPGGVHSHQAHLHALISLAAEKGLKKLAIHAFLDGRDTPPRSALSAVEALEAHCQQVSCGQIASVCGRYYAMDRDKRWERTQQAYDLLTQGSDQTFASASAAIQAAYDSGKTDEFVLPCQIQTNEQTAITIENDDSLIFMNFRSDRARQISHALLDSDFTGFERNKHPKLSHFVSLTQYAADIPSEIAFPPVQLNNVLGAYLADQQLKQLRIAETEKYAHVTFFFNGGREQPFDNEDRELIPSPKVATYDLQPEMSAPELTDKLVQAITSQDYDVIICNYANADMVGHTGDFDATVKAIEAIDAALNRITQALEQVGGQALITADHGNAEIMFDPNTGQTHTAHTCEPVPLLYVGPQDCRFKPGLGTLADIAPTLLNLMSMTPPSDMTGHSLCEIKA